MPESHQPHPPRKPARSKRQPFDTTPGQRRLVGLLRPDASDEEIEEFLSVLNEGIPEAD